jgi:CO/xanthine dehydrogenase Mo-binding subunit
MEHRTSLSRRDLLRACGTCIVSFSITSAFPKSASAQAGSDSDLGKSLDPHEVDSFLAVHADGSVTVYTGKVDIGTGLRIVMRQMAAEELGIPVERVSLVEGDTALTPDQGGTGGSTGTTKGGGKFGARPRQRAKPSSSSQPNNFTAPFRISP